MLRDLIINRCLDCRVPWGLYRPLYRFLARNNQGRWFCDQCWQAYRPIAEAIFAAHIARQRCEAILEARNNKGGHHGRHDF